ncbi:MAG: hypothetical protein ABW298_13835, partial [Candidatus Binatia bacterium]
MTTLSPAEASQPAAQLRRSEGPLTEREFMANGIAHFKRELIVRGSASVAHTVLRERGDFEC